MINSNNNLRCFNCFLSLILPDLIAASKAFIIATNSVVAFNPALVNLIGKFILLDSSWCEMFARHSETILPPIPSSPTFSGS